MKNNSVTEKAARQRKLLFALPILILPFLTLLLWSLGVIGEGSSQAGISYEQGFNLNLPAALPGEDSTWNKLKFYEKADRDSAKLNSLMKSDPYFQTPDMKNNAFQESDSGSFYRSATENQKGLSYNPYPVGDINSPDAAEAKVYKKLAELNNEINRPALPDPASRLATQDHQLASIAVSGNQDQLKQLQSIMENTESSGNGDPEMQQIDGMLEKILDIQHPDRVKDKIRQSSLTHATQVYPVTVDDKTVKISVLQAEIPVKKKMSFASDSGESIRKSGNSFFSLDGKSRVDETKPTVIEALFTETQTIQSGATLKLQLKTDILINGILIPQNHFLYGQCVLNGSRLNIIIKSIHYKQNILPISLSVYDLDGQEGINIPGALSRDVAKQSAEQAIQGIGLASLDPSIGAQAASAGIQAAKSLIGTKTKTVKLTIKESYRVLLKDENQ